MIIKFYKGSMRHLQNIVGVFKINEVYYCNMKLHRIAKKKEWISSLFKEWILEKSEIRVKFGVKICVIHSFWSDHMQGSLRDSEVTPKWVNNTNVHSKFTIISLFSKIHSLNSEHIHSLLFRDVMATIKFWNYL